MPDPQPDSDEYFHVLTRVTVKGTTRIPEGASGVVTQVRRYDDGHIWYSVTVGEDGYILAANQVVSTGHSDPIQPYLPPGSLYPRDVVEFTREETTVRGVVDGWFDDEGTTKYTVWVHSTQTLEIYEEYELTPVGFVSRLSDEDATSTRVSEAGDRLGTVTYRILEDLIELIGDAAPAEGHRLL